MADGGGNDSKSLDDRVRSLELKEAGRDVRVDILTTAVNRLSGIVGAAGLALVGAVVTFVINGG